MAYIVVWPCDSDPADCAVGLGRGACSVLFTFNDQDVWISSSHLSSQVRDEARLAPDWDDVSSITRDGEPITWHAATPEEAAIFAAVSDEWRNEDHHRAMSALGAVLGHRSLDEVARTSGFTPAQLVDEALAWAAAAGRDA